MSVPFHKAMSISSPWKHVGNTDVAVIGRNPDAPNMGRISLMIHSGAAMLNLRPTIAEMTELRDLLTAALYAEATSTFAVTEPA
jgi:hypothetical protein